MNKINFEEIPHLKVLNQYIKDLSYENFRKNGLENSNVAQNETSIDIKVIYEPYNDEHFGVTIKTIIKCKSKKEDINVFQLELEYLGFFKIQNIKDFSQDKLSSEGAKIIFPFVRSIIASITQNGGSTPIILDNVSFNLV